MNTGPSIVKLIIKPMVKLIAQKQKKGQLAAKTALKPSKQK